MSWNKRRVAHEAAFVISPKTGPDYEITARYTDTPVGGGRFDHVFPSDKSWLDVARDAPPHLQQMVRFHGHFITGCPHGGGDAIAKYLAANDVASAYRQARGVIEVDQLKEMARSIDAKTEDAYRKEKDRVERARDFSAGIIERQEKLVAEAMEEGDFGQCRRINAALQKERRRLQKNMFPTVDALDASLRARTSATRSVAIKIERMCAPAWAAEAKAAIEIIKEHERELILEGAHRPTEFRSGW